MNAKHPVIISVDLTAAAKPVVAEGVRLARLSGQPVELMHVVHDLESIYGAYVGGGSVDAIQAELLSEASAKLAELAAAVPNEIGCETLALDGTPWSEIVGRALHVGASYVVVGAHIHEKPEHRILGSTAQRILRHAPCPVLVVRPEFAAEDVFDE